MPPPEVPMETMSFKEARAVLREIPAPGGLLKVSDAAEIVGLNPETLRRRIRRGQLKAWGSPRRVAIADILFPVLPAVAPDPKK